jgi:hypothetical protein
MNKNQIKWISNVFFFIFVILFSSSIEAYEEWAGTWAGSQMNYWVNPNFQDASAGSSANQEAVIDAGMNTWVGPSSFFFIDQGFTTVNVANPSDTTNVIMALPNNQDPTGNCSARALAYAWQSWNSTTGIASGCDIIFCEDSYAWYAGSGSPGANQFDVSTVLDQEAGHCLGLGHSNYTQAVMNPFYTGVKRDLWDCTQCTPNDTFDGGDVQGVQGLYGIPATITLQNQTIGDLEHRFFEATNSISAGTAFTVDSGANATFSAGSEIRLQDGFHAQSGSEFHAKIED